MMMMNYSPPRTRATEVAKRGGHGHPELVQQAHKTPPDSNYWNLITVKDMTQSPMGSIVNHDA